MIILLINTTTFPLIFWDILSRLGTIWRWRAIRFREEIGNEQYGETTHRINTLQQQQQQQQQHPQR